MKKKVLMGAIALALGAGASLQASAQVKPETLVKQRQSVMTLQGKYFGPIGAMVQGKIPYDAAIVTRNAGFLEALAKMPWDGFRRAPPTSRTPTRSRRFTKRPTSFARNPRNWRLK